MELVEAQDYILGVLGSSPTGDITSLNPDAQAARTAISNVKKTLQKKGWWFNTNHNVVMSPNTDNEILLPSNVLKIVPIGNQYIIQRGIKLYDSANNTYIITVDVTADQILNLGWDLLPVDMQDAVRYRAAAELCSTELEDSKKAEEQYTLYNEAIREVKAAHLKSKKQNTFNSPQAQRILRRVRPYRLR